MAKKTNTKTTTASKENLMAILEARFLQNMHRHPNIQWKKVEAALSKNTQAQTTLLNMEETGGEPDIIGIDKASGKLIYCDCAAESPAGRRSLCYDLQAWNDRKEFKPEGNVIDMATKMGITLLTEEDYRYLQTLEAFDTKTSSWILTPDPIRKLDGALFCDRRYNHVFTYHNGAQSYYAARGFRGKILI